MNTCVPECRSDSITFVNEETDTRECILKCDEGYAQMLQVDEVVPYDPELLSSYTCEPCNDNCFSCIDTPDYCLTCKEGYYFNPLENSCNEECLFGLVVN